MIGDGDRRNDTSSGVYCPPSSVFLANIAVRVLVRLPKLACRSYLHLLWGVLWSDIAHCEGCNDCFITTYLSLHDYKVVLYMIMARIHSVSLTMAPV